jgi:hypothetical protein
MGSIACPRCATANPGAAGYCRNCGLSLGRPIESITRISPLLLLWRQLSATLTRKDVRKILGEPARIVVGDVRDPQSVEVMIYEYRARTAGAGDGVNVSSPGRLISGEVHVLMTDGRLVTWREPEFAMLDEQTGEAPGV